MSALPPIATAKADSRKGSCLLYPRKRTCAVHHPMSALGQKQTCAAHGSCPPKAKGGSHFKVCWAGKLVIGDHVTGFLIIAAVGAASGLIQISSARPSKTAARSAADLSAPKRGMCRRPAIRPAVNHL